MARYDVPIGPAIVEFGTVDPVVFDITIGGIVFSVETSQHNVTVDQHGETPVKSILLGRTAQVTVPFALRDLERLKSVIPNSEFVPDSSDPSKMKILVRADAGYDMTAIADKLVVKPTDQTATPNDWITLPFAAPSADMEITYTSDNEQVFNITFTAYPDDDGVLYILGDESAQ